MKFRKLYNFQNVLRLLVPFVFSLFSSLIGDSASSEEKKTCEPVTELCDEIEFGNGMSCCSHYKSSEPVWGGVWIECFRDERITNLQFLVSAKSCDAAVDLAKKRSVDAGGCGLLGDQYTLNPVHPKLVYYLIPTASCLAISQTGQRYSLPSFPEPKCYVQDDGSTKCFVEKHLDTPKVVIKFD